MSGYTRQALANIQNGSVGNADDINAELNQVLAAFNASTGHKHDGTAAEGAPITKVGPVQDLIISATQVLPKTTNTLDLGSATYEFKSAWFDGVVTSDSFVGPVTGDLTGSVLAPSGTAGAPSYSFSNDTTNDTGMYRSGENVIGFSTAGTRKATIGTNFVLDTGVQVLADVSSAASPGLSFSGGATTGFYAPSASVIGFSCAGVLKMSLNTSYLEMESGIEIRAENSGNVLAPSYSFSGDSDTGVYSPGLNEIGFSTGGALRALLTSSAFTLSANCLLQVPDGSAANPSITFTNTPTSGFYDVGTFSAVGLAIAGNNAITFSSFSTAMSSINQLQAMFGSDAEPGYAFNGDADTGFYRVSSNTIGITLGATERARITSTGSLRWGELTTDGVGTSATGLVGVSIGPTGLLQAAKATADVIIVNQQLAGAADTRSVAFRREGVLVGSVSVTASATNYNISSDYRLKDEITWPDGVTDNYDALAYLDDVANALTWFTWKAYPEQGPQLGALAHVLQEVAPHAVTGQKDAMTTEVDEEGVEHEVPDYQGVDWSKLVPNLIAAVAQLNKELKETKERLAVLEAAQ